MKHERICCHQAEYADALLAFDVSTELEFAEVGELQIELRNRLAELPYEGTRIKVQYARRSNGRHEYRIGIPITQYSSRDLPDLPISTVLEVLTEIERSILGAKNIHRLAALAK